MKLCSHTHIYESYIHTHMNLYMHTHMNIYIHTIYIRTFIYAYTHEFVYAFTYMYIYILILSSIDSRFRCITTLQCGETCEILYVGIETRLTLPQSDILPQSYQHSHRNEEIFYVYILKSKLSVTGVVNLWDDLRIYAYVAADESLLECPTDSGEHIYCHPQTDCFVVPQLFSVARHTRCFKLGSKPIWLYVSQILYPRVIVILIA